jgi:hypothetical protein
MKTEGLTTEKTRMSTEIGTEEEDEEEEDKDKMNTETRRKRTWVERAWEMLEALEKERLRPEERVIDWLQWENWERLIKEGIEFAETQIRSRKWRRSKKGVLPEGHDAESIVAEAVQTLLSGKGRLVFGWTWERLQKEFERVIGNEIRRLRKLKEASAVRDEWDFLPKNKEGEDQSIFEEISGGIADGAEEAVRNESDDGLEWAKRYVMAALTDDHTAKRVFGCMCAGMEKREEIAEQLGVRVREVTAARKRIERKAKEVKKFLNFEF